MESTCGPHIHHSLAVCADLLIFGLKAFLFQANSTVPLCCVLIHNGYAWVSSPAQKNAEGWI